MSEWTNVYLPERFSSESIMRDKIRELEFLNRELNLKLDSYEKELHNIFRAAVKYGRIDVTLGKEKITLVLDKP